MQKTLSSDKILDQVLKISQKEFITNYWAKYKKFNNQKLETIIIISTLGLYLIKIRFFLTQIKLSLIWRIIANQMINSYKKLRQSQSTQNVNSFKRPRQNCQEQQSQDNAKLSESESYDEQNEQIKVKIGKIPYGWYDEFKHFGYDNKLQKVAKEKSIDKIEEFIKKSENKDWWRTIRDELNMKDIRLTDQQLQIIDRIRSGKIASKTIATSDYYYELDYNNPMPLHAHPPSKRNFKPSKWEQMKVNKILDGLLSGRIKWNKDEEEKQKQDQLYDAWACGAKEQRGVINIAPTKVRLPGHNQSYNPPKQFLLSEEEKKEWQQMHEEDRPFEFLPNSFNKIRHVPFYDKLIQERFQRCLDLYLCPRIKKKKLNIDPDTLIPKLPDPKTLKPFPTAINITYNRHEHPVCALSVSPTGQYLATGDQSGLFIIWDVLTSRIMLLKQYGQSILSIDWSRNNIVAFSHGQTLQILVWKYSKFSKKVAEELISEAKQANDKKLWNFYDSSSAEYDEGLRIWFKFDADITHVQFQPTKADYFVTVCPDHGKKNEVVSIHRLSKAASETNFIHGGAIFKKVSFYPKKPQIVILTQSKVVVYNLQDLTILKKLSAGSNMYKCISIHPEGSYIMVGTQTQKLVCYDIDLSSKPYKIMQFHEKAITAINFHKQYPLMASSSNDGTIHVFHFKNNTEIMQDAVMMPLKVLRGHTIKSLEGVKNIIFHPKQPWIFSAGSDGKVLLWT